MLFNYEDLKETILYGDNYEEKGLFHIESSEWTQEHKAQSREIIFQYDGKYYSIEQYRTGSPFTDWHYEDYHLTIINGMVELSEVYKNTKTVEYWSHSLPEKNEIEERLSEAEDLLGDAISLLNNIHGYDTETYRNISKFIHGEDEE